MILVAIYIQSMQSTLLLFLQHSLRGKSLLNDFGDPYEELLRFSKTVHTAQSAWSASINDHIIMSNDRSVKVFSVKLYFPLLKNFLNASIPNMKRELVNKNFLLALMV